MIRRIALIAVVALYVTACSSIGGGTPPVGSVSAVPPVSGCRALVSTVAAHPAAADADRATLVLSRFAMLGWNPTAPPVRPSKLTGGLFVNYRTTWNGAADPAANTNITTVGDSDAENGGSPRHDPLTDLALLRNIDALQSTGDTDAQVDQLRCRLQPVVEAEFVTYGVVRGWVYNDLIDLSRLDSTGPWLTQAKTFATLLAKRFAGGIDPKASFRPDWVAESAAALTDAGKRFGQPAWTALGSRVATQLVATSADPRTGFFPGSAQLAEKGPAVVKDPLVKVGSQAQLVDALLSVYDDTHDAQILAAVRKNLTSLQSSSIGPADTVNGGWFFGVNSNGTGVRTSYKETRQGWLVPMFRHAATDGLVTAAVVDSTAAIVRDKLYQPDSRGYVYRVRPDWTPFISTQNGARVEETWVSSEATGIAVQALLGPLA